MYSTLGSIETAEGTANITGVVIGRSSKGVAEVEIERSAAVTAVRKVECDTAWAIKIRSNCRICNYSAPDKENA